MTWWSRPWAISRRPRTMTASGRERWAVGGLASRESAGGVDGPAVDALDQVEALGDGEERCGRDELPACAVHPQQELVERDLAGLQRLEGLGHEREGVLLQGSADA